MRLFFTGVLVTLGAIASTEAFAQENEIFGQPEFEDFEEVEQESETAALAEAEKIETTPYPFNFFSTLDFTMGVMLGFYAPVAKRWRNWDCQSQFFSMALAFTNFSKLFDKPYESSFGQNLALGLQVV